MEDKLFNVPVEFFRLEKITIDSENECTVNCMLVDSTRDKIYTLEMNGLKPNYQCTEELRNKMIELKEYLCKIHKIPTNKATMMKVHVKSVEFKGIDEKETFNIRGRQESDSEQMMSLPSCKIHFAGGYYGFEDKIKEIKEELTIMAHSYIFNKQSAEISLGLKGVDNTSYPDENNPEDEDVENVETVETVED